MRQAYRKRGVVIDEPVSLPNGTPVRVEVLENGTARSRRPEPGLGKGGILSMAPDFDETPEEFKDSTG